MKLNRTTWMAAVLGTVAVTGMVGCGKGSDASGQGAATVTVHQQALTDISKVTVSVSGTLENVSLASIPLVGNAGLSSTQYSAVVSDLPIGCDYIFTASAVDSTNTLIYTGTSTAQCITKNQTANIIIDMADLKPHSTINDEAPFIDALTDTASCVSVGDTVTIKATMHDIDSGDTAGMTWAWSVASCGTLTGQVDTAGTDSVNATSTVTFTAVTNNTNCQVNLVVKDKRMPTTLQTTAAVVIKIGDACAFGNAKITAIPDTCPAITGVSSSRSPLVADGQPTTLTVTASDSDGDILNYNWTSDCASATVHYGYFISGGLTSTTATGNPVQFVYTGPGNLPTAVDCNFYTTVDDGKWTSGQLQGQTKCSVVDDLSLGGTAAGYVQQDSCAFSYDYLSSNSVGDGDVVTLQIDAPCSNPVWSAGTSTTPTGAPFNTAVTVTTPTGSINNGDVVTVTCGTGATACSHTFTMIGKAAFCATAAAGADCTTSAQLTNKCVQSATCNATGQCVAQTTVTCSPSTTACQVNTCNTATGVCGLVAGPNGGTCSDGLACTTGDTCNGGICQPTGAVTCTPTGSVCSVNACQEPSGTCAVTNAPSTTTCSDGLLCTTGDHCNGSGTCAGTQITCPSGDACYETGSTAGTCVAQQCSYPAPNSAQSLGAPILNGIGGGTTTLWSTGKFYTAVNFGANTISNTGSADMFLNKLDPTTGKAIASFDLGVPPTGGGDQIGAGVSVDKNNNALVIGSYSNKVQFTASGNTQGVNVLKDVASVSGTAMNFFMVVNGTSSNATSAPYIVPVKGQSVDVGSGALIATASNPNVNGFAFCGKTSIGDLGVGIGNNGVTTGGATNGGGVDIIVAFVNDDGSIKWGQQYGGAGDQQCTAIAVDGSGNVYITGTNGGDLTQFGSSFIASGSGVAVPYVAVLNAADGTVKKAATWGTTGNNAANSIATDGTQVYVGGALGANIAFGGVSLTDSGLTDAYIVKMDAATLTPSCGVSLGDAANDQAVKGLGLDPTGATLYVGGIFSGTLSPTTLVSTGGSLDAFTMEFGTANCSINSCLKQITEDPAYYPGVPAGTQTVGMVAMQGSTMANWWIGGSYSSSMALGAGATAVSLPPTGSAGTIWYYVAHLLP